MKTKLSVLLVAGVVGWGIALSLTVEPTHQQIEFELKDQFGTVYNQETFTGGPWVVVGADSAGSSYSHQWSTELKRLAAERRLQVRFVGLADLRAVPAFMRSSVRGKFPQDPEDWTLLDWKGKIAGTFGFARRHCNLLLFSATGQLLYQGAGRELDSAELDRFAKALESLPTADSR